MLNFFFNYVFATLLMAKHILVLMMNITFIGYNCFHQSHSIEFHCSIEDVIFSNICT